MWFLYAISAVAIFIAGMTAVWYVVKFLEEPASNLIDVETRSASEVLRNSPRFNPPHVEALPMDINAIHDAAYVAMHPPNLPPFKEEFPNNRLLQKSPKNILGRKKTFSVAKENRVLIEVAKQLQKLANNRVGGELGHLIILQGQSEGLKEAASICKNNVKTK